MDGNTTGLAEAYQLAARELRSLQRLAWEELAAREDAPWVFGAPGLRRLSEAHGGVTIVDGYGGDPGVKSVSVALEWEHGRQGRRTVRLICCVSREDPGDGR